MQVETNITMQCALDLTANARNGMLKWFKSEQALFASEQNFYVYIEKRPENRHGNQSFSFYFDNVRNENLANQLSERVAVMECVFKNDGFLATGFHVRGKREPVETNRRFGTNLKFILNRRIAAPMPIELYTALRELPIAEERSEYVKKRIASWEGYLRIQEMNADVEDVKTSFSSPRISENFSQLQIICRDLRGKDLRAINGFSANISGITGDIGNVIQVKSSEKLVEIELTPKYKNMARRHELNIRSFREITFSNFAELSQVRRLRKGFKDLQDGLAANSNLEKVLFEERPVVRITNKKKELTFHNRLNEFQREAVVGAMTANDLYVIQGPPGTGKTTVISEICYQNAKAGLRTLVASQANLAVDNALGRLLDDQDIRILRYGRTESIEEEGKKFIEENVATHWKEQTIQALDTDLQQHKEKAAQLEAETININHLIESANENLKLVEARIEEKTQAKEAFESISSTLGQLLSSRDSFSLEQAQLQNTQLQLSNEREQLQEKIEHLAAQLKLHELQQEELATMEQVATEIKSIERLIELSTLLEKESQLKLDIIALKEEQSASEMQLQRFEQFLEESLFLLKLEDLQACIVKFQIDMPEVTKMKIAQLEQLIFKIKEILSKNTFDVWNTLDQRLDKAIPMLENVLKEQGFLNQIGQRGFRSQNLSPEKVHAFLDRMGRFLVAPQTKQLFATRNYSAEKYDALEKLASAYVFLRQQKDYVRMQYAHIEEQKNMIEQSKQLFKDIKKETIEVVNELSTDLTLRTEETVRKLEALPAEQAELQNRLQDYPKDALENNERVDVLNEKMNTLTNKLVTFEEKRQTFQTYKVQLEQDKQKINETAEAIEKTAEALLLIEQKIEGNEKEIVHNKAQCEALQEILQTKPEEDKTDLLSEIESKHQKLAAINEEKEQLPTKELLQEQWLAMLKNATDYDLDEIKKLYIQHANVIGTTCVASARRDFMEDYPTFDVVIIDEVSKATPPELLLPMLKGKKIILVGDHHQLPPLMGQETLEEFLEESSDAKEKKELEQLLKESLFERLFRTLPKQNKTMLGIQYRMHEKIMDTITPFYNEGDYALQCGLEDSDAARDHLLESRHFNRDHHLLWFDVPNEKLFFEDRVKGGTSRFNESELAMICTLLIDLNKATEEAIVQGRIPAGTKKNIGVISFYGEQVKRIDRLIQHELQLPNLHCRTGSVDKFQGMEMDVIILSFVRNHDHPGGDIGFAKDYRRLNVALSRARELLMIVGSAEMFTKRPKNENTRQMFERLLQNVEAQDGVKELLVEVN